MRPIIEAIANEPMYCSPCRKKFALSAVDTTIRLLASNAGQSARSIGTMRVASANRTRASAANMTLATIVLQNTARSLAGSLAARATFWAADRLKPQSVISTPYAATARENPKTP